MYIDPRIQGHLKELIEACDKASLINESVSYDLAKQALEHAQEGGDPFEIATSCSYVAALELSVGNISRATDLWAQVKEYSEKAEEFWLLARAYRGTSMCYSLKHEFDTAEKYCLESLRLCEQQEIQHHLIPTLLSLAHIYSWQGRYQEGIKVVHRMQDLIESLDPGIYDEKEVGIIKFRVSTMLGLLLQQIGDYRAMLKNNEQALEFALKNNLTSYAILGYDGLGCSYYGLGEYDKAIESHLKALDLIASEPRIENRIDQMLGLCQCYLKKGDVERAEQVIEEAWELSTKQSDNVNFVGVLFYRGKVKLARKDPESIILFLEALEMKHKSGDAAELGDLLIDIRNYYRGIGDYEHALQYYDEYVKHMEKIGQEKQRTFSRVHERHETERLEQEKKIFQLTLEKSQIKLQHQERELALTASQLAGQADLLSHFRNDLRKIVRDMADPIDALRHIKQKLKDLPCEQIDWAKFESEFITVHPEFRRTLLGKYPDLTSQETKMCMLARIGLKNAEIARLTCLSERSVENHRFNLRKKLGLKTEQNLTQFLAALK